MPYRGKYGVASNRGIPFCLTASEKTLSVLSKGVRHNPERKAGLGMVFQVGNQPVAFAITTY